jgi:hypothetical protein
MTPLWLEIFKLAANFATPIVIAIIGFFFLRKVEGIKAGVARNSEFQKKWADEFFVCGQQFMKALQREMASLIVLNGLKDRNEKLRTSILEEISQLHITLPELEFSIQFHVVFVPTSGER